MTQEEEKPKPTIKNDEKDNEKTSGKAELSKTPEEKEKRKLDSCSDSLNPNSADVIKNHSIDEHPPVSAEQPESEDTYELPTLLNLVVQRHEGGACDGQFHGEGVACFKGGHMYKGMFSKGLMDGYGVFTQAGGLKYEGEFVCNVPMGKGTLTWPDGSSYKGDVFNGIRHGTGTYQCAKTGMSYTGQWDQGKRHGKGTVYYNQDKTSWYKGDWVKNSKDGWGERRYPSGNIYRGEWKNNLRHGKGMMRWLKRGQQYDGMWHNGLQEQVTCKDGHDFEGDLQGQMMAHNLSTNRTSTPLRGPLPLSGSYSSILPDMALKINYLLDLIPKRERDTERTKVEFAVIMHGSELRSIYSFYSRLGHAHSSKNISQMTRLQFWRLLKDCNIHHHDNITLAQINHLIREDATTAEIHSPFTTMLLHNFLSCLVVVAYHIYHKDMVSHKNLLAACFSKLMTNNILPNAKNVKGFLFRQPDCAVVASAYLKKSWEIYQAHCKVYTATRDEQTMTCRHLLWMFKDLNLLDNNLTAAKVMEIITAESCDRSNLSSCLNVEIAFLEFFEVLVGCAQVCQQVSEGTEEGQLLLSPDFKGRKDLAENKTETSSGTAEFSTPQDMETQENVKMKVCEKSQSTEQTGGKETRESKLELRIQMINQFFNQLFFPAFEHYQLVSRHMKEAKLQQEAEMHHSG